MGGPVSPRCLHASLRPEITPAAAINTHSFPPRIGLAVHHGHTTSILPLRREILVASPLPQYGVRYLLSCMEVGEGGWLSGSHVNYGAVVVFVLLCCGYLRGQKKKKNLAQCTQCKPWTVTIDRHTSPGYQRFYQNVMTCCHAVFFFFTFISYVWL